MCHLYMVGVVRQREVSVRVNVLPARYLLFINSNTRNLMIFKMYKYSQVFNLSKTHIRYNTIMIISKI